MIGKKIRRVERRLEEWKEDQKSGKKIRRVVRRLEELKEDQKS